MSIAQFIPGVDRVFSDMVDSIDKINIGFARNKEAPVSDVICEMALAHDEVERITELIATQSKHDPAMAHLVSIPTLLERMQDDLCRLSRCIRRKISDDVLFSDLAIEELTYMLERGRDIILHLKDLSERRSDLVHRHIMETSKVMERLAEEYSTRHEERLIEGLCMPRASSIFLEALGALKNLAWLSREMAKDLGAH